MTLRGWSFEKVARKRVRAEVRASQSLRKERRLARAAGKRKSGIRPWMYRLFFLGFLATFAFIARLLTVEYVVALILLWTLATVFLYAGQLQAALYDDPGLIVFDYWPISDSEIFRAQWKRFLRGTAWTLCDFAVGYSILLVHASGGWHALAGGVVLGAVQWLFIVALAVCLAAFAQPKRFAVLAFLFPVAAIFFLLSGQNQPRLCAWLSGLAWWVPPVGWILQSLGVSEGGGVLRQVLPAVMSATVLALAPMAFRRVRQGFLLSEPRHATDGRTPELIEFGERQAQSADDARAVIQSRQFLAGLDWQKAGVVERFFSRLLNARERVLAEFLLAGNPGWTAQFRGVLPYFLLVMAALWLFGLGWIPKAATLVFIVASLGAVQVFSSLRGFGLPPEGGLQSPYYAIYPIGFWELMRVVLKINLTKTFVFLPFLLVAAAWCGAFRSPAVWDGLRWIALALMVQPLLVIAAISPNSNDTQRRGSACLIFALMSLLLAAGAGFYFAPDWRLAALAGFVASAVSVVALWLYGRWFNRSRFDLVPLRRPEQE